MKQESEGEKKRRFSPPSDATRVTLTLDMDPGTSPNMGWMEGKCLPRLGGEEAGQGGPALLWK